MLRVKTTAPSTLLSTGPGSFRNLGNHLVGLGHTTSEHGHDLSHSPLPA